MKRQKRKAESKTEADTNYTNFHEFKHSKSESHANHVNYILSKRGNADMNIIGLINPSF